MSTKDQKAVVKHDKSKDAHYMKEVRKFFVNMYRSAGRFHKDMCDSLSKYISSNFGYAPGRGNFPNEGNYLPR